MAKLDLIAGFPTIAETQFLKNAEHRYGKITRARRSTRAKGRYSVASWWIPYLGRPISQVNRDFLRYIAAYWKNTLTAGQRANWNAAAVGISWTGYGGKITNPNGFQMWVACQRAWHYSHFYPFYPNAGITHFTGIVTPPTWNPQPAPAVTVIDIFNGNDMYINITNDPEPYTTQILTTVARARNPTGPTNPKNYIDTYNNWPAQISNGNEYGDIYFDYPGPADSAPRSVRIGLRFFNPYTLQFGDPTWILASP